MFRELVIMAAVAFGTAACGGDRTPTGPRGSGELTGMTGMLHASLSGSVSGTFDVKSVYDGIRTHDLAAGFPLSAS